MRAYLAAATTSLALAGCLESLVSGTCADGYVLADGECRSEPEIDPGPDPETPPPDPEVVRPTGTFAPDPDPIQCPPDQLACGSTCTDLQSDANACGSCGVVCPSGICVVGACVGDVPGRVILIGHDYADRNVSSTRLLGNALDLPFGSMVRVVVWRGTASDAHAAAAGAALIAAAAAAGITSERIDVDQLPATSESQIVVILPQDGPPGDAAVAGAAWATAGAEFVNQGGIVIGLGGAGTVTDHVLAGAGLLDATLADDATGDDLAVVAPTDALAAGVAAPYRAEQSTASYTAGRGVVVVEDEAGYAVVIDAAGS